MLLLFHYVYTALGTYWISLSFARRIFDQIKYIQIIIISIFSLCSVSVTDVQYRIQNALYIDMYACIV